MDCNYLPSQKVFHCLASRKELHYRVIFLCVQREKISADFGALNYTSVNPALTKLICIYTKLNLALTV